MPADPVDDMQRTPSGRRRVEYVAEAETSSSTRRRFAPDVAHETTDKPFPSSRAYSDEALRQKRYKPEPELDFLRPGARWSPAGGSAPPLPDLSRPSTTATSSRKVTSTSPRLMVPLRADIPPPPPLQKCIKLKNLDEKFLRQYQENEVRQRRLELLKAQVEEYEDAKERVDKAFDGSDEEFIERFVKDPSAHKAQTMERLQQHLVQPSPRRRLTAEELKASTSRLYNAGMEHTKLAMQRAVADYVGRVSPPRKTISREAMVESSTRLYTNRK